MDEAKRVSAERRLLLRVALTAPLLGIGLTIPGMVAANPAELPARKPPQPGPIPAAAGPVRQAAGKTAPARAANAAASPRIIVLDPGHGGHDPGAIGGSGTLEKDVTLDICRTIRSQLAGHPGLTIRLTRSRDEFLPLADRVARARTLKADLFVSIHADSAPNHEARGLSAYTLAGRGSDALAAALAQQENRVGDGGLFEQVDAEVAAVLQDLVLRQTRNASLQAKAALVNGCSRRLRLLENPMRAANFAVLRAPDVPSVLIETGFLSNHDDEALLSNPQRRRGVADVLASELTSLVAHPPFA